MNSVMLFHCFKGEFYELKLIVQIRFKFSNRKRPYKALLSSFINFRNYLYRRIRKAFFQKLF